MKREFLGLASAALFAALAAGCGGGGGGGGSTTVTGATAKVLLFGSMSSSSRVAAVQTTLPVPSGVLVNYSSPAPAGYPANTYPLRGGSIIPSGAVHVAASDLSGSYNTSTGLLSVSLLNSNRVPLKSSNVAMGAEIAAISFKLVSPGVLPVLPDPWQDAQVTVWQELATPPVVSVVSLPGFKLNLATTYH
jgi:hypothetical protein